MYNIDVSPLAPRTSHLAPRTSHPAPRTPHLAPRNSHSQELHQLPAITHNISGTLAGHRQHGPTPALSGSSAWVGRSSHGNDHNPNPVLSGDPYGGAHGALLDESGSKPTSVGHKHSAMSSLDIVRITRHEKEQILIKDVKTLSPTATTWTVGHADGPDIGSPEGGQPTFGQLF